MLAAAQRLRRREEFAATVRGGRRASRGVIVVHLVLPPTDVTTDIHNQTAVIHRHQTEPASAQSAARAGFVVPKAVGTAVVRNRVRRRLRHLVRERLAVLPAGAAVVVRALPGAADRGYGELAADLDAAVAAASRPRGRARDRSGPRRESS